MSYIVSARKYRPQTFESVLGQEHVTSTLKSALMTDKLAHAFLFCGPRGVGKTTCARLLAKVINMDDPKAALQDGSYADSDIDISFNIFELDGASNNKTDDIRYLTDQVRVPPQKGKYKVFIIDEVHMLTPGAFNAFLKTLEEPPPYAIFILATTEKHKILPTILSRCQLYDFRRIGVKDIIAQLHEIAEKEGIQVEEDALMIIADKADGAMRDALSIFDRISSASNGNVSYDKVIETLNVLDYEHYFRATDLIISQDGPNMLVLLHDIISRGFEADVFMNGLAVHLRNLMYCKQEPTVKLLEVSDRLKQKYLDQSRAISYGTILSAINLLNEADVSYGRAKDHRLHTEIVLLKICYVNQRVMKVLETEKKTPEVTLENNTKTRPSNPVSHIPTAKEEKTETPPTSPLPIVNQPSKQEENQEHQEKSEKDPAPKPSQVEAIKKVKSVNNTPIFSSLDDLIKNAESQIAQGKMQVKSLDLSELKNVWKDYHDKLESVTLKGILHQVELELGDDSILVNVPTSLAKEEIQQEVDLFSAVRAYFGRPDLHLKIKVDRDKFPDHNQDLPKKLYTPKEKYEHLKSQNPLLDKLIKELDLKLDQS